MLIGMTGTRRTHRLAWRAKSPVTVSSSIARMVIWSPKRQRSQFTAGLNSISFITFLGDNSVPPAKREAANSATSPKPAACKSADARFWGCSDQIIRHAIASRYRIRRSLILRCSTRPAGAHKCLRNGWFTPALCQKLKRYRKPGAQEKTHEDDHPRHSARCYRRLPLGAAPVLADGSLSVHGNFGGNSYGR